MIDDASEGEKAVINDAQVGDIVYSPEALEKFYKGEITVEELKATKVAEEEKIADEVDATPSALAHAKSLGVDISAIKGSGTGGRVLKSDVEAAVAAEEAAKTGQ